MKKQIAIVIVAIMLMAVLIAPPVVEFRAKVRHSDTPLCY